jgi:hypothetical protein
MNIQALHKEKHAALRVKPLADYAHLANIQYLPLLVTEFLQAAIDLPILFLKNADTGKFQPVAMLGLKRATNAFVADGRWQGHYLPAIARQVPFRLISSAEHPDRLYVGIDADHSTVSNAEGEALFDDAGNETPYLERRKRALFEYAEHTQLTHAFLELLIQHDLLREKTLTYGPDGTGAGIRGLYVVDDQRLNALPADDYLRLRDRGFLGGVYAHLVSLNQVRRLAATAGEPAAD